MGSSNSTQAQQVDSKPEGNYNLINSKSIQYATDVFKKFDTSNDGKIQLSEAIQGFRSMKISFDESTLQKIIFLVDSDFDGELDLKEFVRLFIISEIAQQDIKIQQELMLFFAADLNFNGKIDREEYSIVCQKCGYSVDYSGFEDGEIGVDLFIQKMKCLRGVFD